MSLTLEHGPRPVALAAEMDVRALPTFRPKDVTKSVTKISGYALRPDVMAASGSTGVVIGGVVPDTDRRVTVKVGFGSGPVALEHARREADLQRSAHQATSTVPDVLHSGEEELTIKTPEITVENIFPVRVTEFAPGVSLDEIIKYHGSLGVRKTVQYLRPIAVGLDSMHRAGIAQGDTTPRNVVVQGPSKGAIIDFDNGFRGTMKANEAPVGTPGYIAPEEYKKGEIIEPEVDNWKFASTAFTAITGVRLIPGENAIAQMNILGNEEAYTRFLDERLDVLSPSVRKVMARALHYDPLERYTQAASFIHALERANQIDEMRIKLKTKASTIFRRRA